MDVTEWMVVGSQPRPGGVVCVYETKAHGAVDYEVLCGGEHFGHYSSVEQAAIAAQRLCDPSMDALQVEPPEPLPESELVPVSRVLLGTHVNGALVSIVTHSNRLREEFSVMVGEEERGRFSDRAIAAAEARQLAAAIFPVCREEPITAAPACQPQAPEWEG